MPALSIPVTRSPIPLANVFEILSADSLDTEVLPLARKDQVLELSTAKQKDKYEDVKKCMLTDQEKVFLEQLEEIVQASRTSYQ